MKKAVLSLAFFLCSTPAFAQLNLVPDRLLMWSYDKNQTVAGCSDGLNTGVFLTCPSQNVHYKKDLGIWDVQLVQVINGVTYVGHVFLPGPKIGYYPHDNTFSWYDGTVVLSGLLGGDGTGWLECYGQDGVLNVEGDLNPGTDNGVYFRRPVTGMQILQGGPNTFWYMNLLVKYQGEEEYEIAVYPTAFCGFIPAN